MPSYDTQQSDIQRQQMIAQALRDSGNIPASEVTRSSGRFIVPISKFEVASKLLSTGLGAYAQHSADSAQDALNDQKQADSQKALSGILDQLAGPEAPPPTASSDTSTAPTQLAGSTSTAAGDTPPPLLAAPGPSTPTPGIPNWLPSTADSSAPVAPPASPPVAATPGGAPPPTPAAPSGSGSMYAAALNGNGPLMPSAAPTAAAPAPTPNTGPGGPPAAPATNSRRAALAAILGNLPPDQAVQLLRGPALASFEPKPDYDLAEGATRMSGTTNTPIASGAAKTYRPAEADRALVKVIDPTNKAGYRTVERKDFDPKSMNEWVAPTAAQMSLSSMTPGGLEEAVQFATIHDSHPPPGYPRSGPVYGEFLNALHEHYLKTGNDVGQAQITSELNKSDQSSLTNITKLRDNTTQARGTLEKNLNSLQDAYDKAGDSGTEFGNKVYRAWQTGTGDPTLKPVRAYLAAAQKEYAKLQMNSFGNAMTSDAANADAAKVINDNFTQGGIKAVIGAMRGEAVNRTSALDETYEGIKSRMTSRSHPNGATDNTPKAPPAVIPAIKALPAGDKLTAYAAAHFNGDTAKAAAFLKTQGYQ